MYASLTVQQYWDERAAASREPNATTDDVWLRELEIATIVETLNALHLRDGATLLDAGCGDGFSTLWIAEALPNLKVSGVDFSKNMIRNAEQRLASLPELAGRVGFQTGSVTDLDGAFGDRLFDVILTDRCLINLETEATQALALGQIAGHVAPGGVYIGIENFAEGNANLNAARAGLGLPKISVRWHNLYFTEARFRQETEARFASVEINDFASSYYLATRVLYSAFSRDRSEPIDYQHDLHRLAVKLPPAGQFSPIRMAIARKA